MLVQSSGALRASDLQYPDTWLKLIQDSGDPRLRMGPMDSGVLRSSIREKILHRISGGRQEIGASLFLRDLRARIFSSSMAMSRSMILRATSNGLPIDEAFKFGLAGEKTTGRQFWFQGTKEHTLSHMISRSTSSRYLPGYRDDDEWLLSKRPAIYLKLSSSTYFRISRSYTRQSNLAITSSSSSL